jgi:membrane-associated phospholipid phosphatase
MDAIYALQAFASPALDDFMLFVTNLGSERAYILFLLVAYLAVDAVVGQRLAIALLAGFYLNFHLKGLFDTPRPYLIDPDVARGEAAVLTGPGAGFPSGHASGSATFWGLAAVYARRAWFWVLALVIIALVSLSRVYLGLHVPLDVWGGLVLGALIVAGAYAAFRALAGAGRWPLGLVLALGLGVPLALHLLLPAIDSDLLLGGMAAFITGPRLVAYRPHPVWWRRALVALTGIVVVFALLTGSSLLLPEALKRDALGGFLRYLLLGYAGVVLVPWLAQAVGLAPRGVHAATAQAAR